MFNAYKNINQQPIVRITTLCMFTTDKDGNLALSFIPSTNNVTSHLKSLHAQRDRPHLKH